MDGLNREIEIRFGTRMPVPFKDARTGGYPNISPNPGPAAFPKFCTNCGAKAGSRFCPECGAKLV